MKIVPPEYALLETNSEKRVLLYIVENFSEQFLRFLPRNIRDFPSHGLDHTLNIITYLDEFVKNWEIDLTQDEALILYSAAWAHDIGCIKERERHNEISSSLILENTSLCESLTEKYVFCLKYVILSHSSKYSIDSVPENHENIRLKLICAIFRLIDACEIYYVKCPRVVFEIIKDSLDDTAIKYWEGHMNIISLKFKKPDIQLIVNDQNASQLLIDKLISEIESIRKIFESNDIQIPLVKVY